MKVLLSKQIKIPANCDKYSAESLCGRYSNITTVYKYYRKQSIK